MSGPAQVRSTDSIEALNVALALFAERVQNALDALDGELHRADDWIEHDRPGHWRGKVKEAEDGLHQAKLDLEKCLLMTTADGQRPACREQKSAVERARARLEYCREKAEKVRHWQRNFRHEMFEYDGRIGQLRGLLDQEVPVARALLTKIVRRLEEYRIEQPPDLSAAFDADSQAPPPPLSAKPPSTDDASTKRNPQDQNSDAAPTDAAAGTRI